MKKDNLYIAQIGEAIKYYQDSIYEYRRLSLILLDNVVEVILKEKLSNHLYLHYRKKLSKDQIEDKIKGLIYHENVTKEALNTILINEDEKRVIDFCHEIRNSQYHEPSEYSYILTKDNYSLIECGILSLIEFLITKYYVLTKSDYIEFSLFKSNREKLIFEKNLINIPEQIILKLAECLSYAEKKPSEIIGDIINDDIICIAEFYECDAKEEWEIFNSLTKEYYKFYKSKINPNDTLTSEIKDFPTFNESKISKLKNRVNEIKKLQTSKAIEKMKTFTDEYNKVLIGMKMYQYEQERIAYENED